MKNWSMVHAGDLREVVIIQRRAVSKDAYGTDVETWAERATVRAMVEVGVFRGSEALVYGQRVIQSESPTRVTLRYRGDVSVRDRVNWQGRLLNVETVRDPESGRRRWLELICTEVQQ